MSSSDMTTVLAPPSYSDVEVQPTRNDTVDKDLQATRSQIEEPTIAVILTLSKATVLDERDLDPGGKMLTYPDRPGYNYQEAFMLPLAMTLTEFIRAAGSRYQQHFAVDIFKPGIQGVTCQIDFQGTGQLDARTKIAVPNETSWTAAKQLMQSAKGHTTIRFMYAPRDVKNNAKNDVKEHDTQGVKQDTERSGKQNAKLSRCVLQ